MVVFWNVVAVVVAVLKEAMHLSFLSSFSFGKHRGGGRRECWWMFLCSNTVSWNVVSWYSDVEGVSPDLSLSVGPGCHRQL